MTFAGLFTKLGKQPIRDTQSSPITAIFDVDDLKQLIDKAKETNSAMVSIPLDLRFGAGTRKGTQKMWFVKRKETDQRG